MPEGKVASSTLLRATPLLALALRAAADGTTARVTVDTAVAYNSSDWSSSWVELESVRNILGTMNGPREVYAFDDEHGAYDTAQYAASFDELAPYAVRFNDMNYLNGGYNSTSITQIFRAWPLTDAALSALTASEIAALASDDGNYVWEGVDYNVGGACAAGSVELMDFRVGDTYQVTNALNKGEAVPMGGGNATTFPASCGPPSPRGSRRAFARSCALRSPRSCSTSSPRFTSTRRTRRTSGRTTRRCTRGCTPRRRPRSRPQSAMMAACPSRARTCC